MSRYLLAFVTAAGFLAACTDSPDDPADPGDDPPPPAAVELVEVDAPPNELLPGEQVQLVARAFDADGQPVTVRTFAWESDNVAVATVNDAGLVTALASGEVTIYATTALVSGGAFLTVTEVVEPPPPPPVTSGTLVAIGPTPLPATLGTFTSTLPEGGTITRSVRLQDGWIAFDHGSGTYELTLSGVHATSAFWVPVPISYDSAGAMTVSPTTGIVTFTPQVGDAFSGRWIPGGLELYWQPDARMSNTPTLVFAND